MTVLVISPAAYSKPKKKKAAAEPTATVTPTATPTPEVHLWNFDQDKAGEVPAGWKAIEGDWQVIPDPSAPSKPNTYGLPAGRMLKSLTGLLAYYPMTIETDPTEYSDFTLEAQFKSAGGRFDCSGGLIFRYVDEKNFYLLSAGCPSDYFALSRMTNGQLATLKQQVVPTDKDTWYRLKVTAQGGHFSCYDDDKMIFDFDDNKIAKGKIGLWAADDSQAQFDDVKLTVLGAGESGSAPAASPSP
jgi:3-keto-disaccharide hydrolase